MRWALRQPNSSSPASDPRPTGGGSNPNPATTSGLIYIDPVNLRRTNASSFNGALTTVVQSAAAAAAASTQLQDESSTSCTVNNLSRAFGIILRQVIMMAITTLSLVGVFV